MRNDFLIDTESGCILLKDLAVKSSNGNRVSQSGSVESCDRSLSNLSHADKIANTQKLLDRAIAYAWHTVKSDRRPPKLTRTRWVWRLAGAYHSSCQTSRLMEEASERFAASGRMSLAQWAAQRAKEEAGHDRLALLDIQSMGYEAEAVVQALVPSGAKDFVDYFTQIVQATDPINCVGLSYAGERLGTFQGKEYIQSVEALLPPDTHATRWLRVHSGVGVEVKHVEETIKFITNHLTPQEHIRVVRACYETALLRFTPPKKRYILDEELQNVLKPLELNTFV
jgi:pyrroloquinoline quinone (PQQ) biosynthesis protein C